MVEILRKRRAAVELLEVQVEGEQRTEPPWSYESVTLHFRVAGEGLTVAVLARVIRLSVVRYCSVIATLVGVAAIAATIELIAGDGTTSGRRPIELAIPAAPLADGIEPISDED